MPEVEPAEPDATPDTSHLGTVAPGGFAGFYAEHFRTVWRNLRRLGVPDATLDDAVQDVFLVAHRRFGAFAGRSTLKTWVFGIVLRVAHDHRRAVRRHQARVDRYAAASLRPVAAMPDETAERLRAARLVQAVLDELEDEQRAVFVLVELEQLTVKEAAQSAGLGLATCQRRLRAARTAFEAGMRRRLSGEDGAVHD